MATPSQSILWTTLPNGFVTLPDGKRLPRISVFVTPRLVPRPNEQVLKPFELFLDWPAIVEKHLRLKLVFNNGGATGELKRLKDADPLDSSMWKRLFNETTFVRGHTFTDLKDTVIRSFPAADIQAYIEGLYSLSASDFGGNLPERNPTTPSPNHPLTHLAQQLGRLTEKDSNDRYRKLLEGKLEETKVLPQSVPSGFSSREQYAFYQASRFYRRPTAEVNKYSEGPQPELTPAPPKKPEFDFHQALAAFGDYPRLLRRLGLVLDFAWTNPAPLASTGRVRVEVEWGDPHVLPAWHEKDNPPWTAYRFEGAALFRPRSTDAGSDLNSGYLDLTEVRDTPMEQKKEARYFIGQVDLDGSALKAVDFANSLVRMQRSDVSNYRTPDRAGLPALRTAGLALYRNGRAASTHQQLKRASAAHTLIANNQKPEFFAEDLLRGFRVDVWDDVSKDWHSLCAREGRYLFKNGGSFILDLADEGYVKGASVSRAEPGAPRDLYLHERLAGFDGWSLVAPRPGKILDKDPSASEPAAPVEDAGTQFGFASWFRPGAGSLPRLRFGRSYRLRIRMVDIAGNGITFKEADEKKASQLFLYTRFEPVPSPTLLLRARVTEGESLERLVIRSDYDATTGEYIARADVQEALEAVRVRLELTDAAREGYTYLEGNERHLAPPKTSQLEAELHGRFDPFIGPGKDHAKGFRLAQRESGTFLSKTIVNLNTGADEPIPGLDLEVVPPTGDSPTDLDDPARQPGDALQQGEYVLHKEPQLIVPYLPDPFATGVVFMGLPGGTEGEPYPITFAKAWPNPQPFRIRLVERPGAMDGCSQVFSHPGKPKWDAAANVLTVFLPKGVEATVQYSSLLASDQQAREMALWKWLEQRGKLSAKVRKLILSGRHWMFTPWRTLTLVHAVQHPLCAPTIVKWSSARGLGHTFAVLSGPWHLSVKSTAKVDLNAAWVEPIDDVAQSTWHEVERSAHVAEVPIEPMFSDNHPIPATETGAPPLSRKPLLHEFGDTKHRRVRYRLKGTTRFREYFPIELTRHEAAITRLGPEFSPEAGKPGIVILNSARPAAPRPVYVLPTFLWEETALAGGGLVRRRRGNGLRVYLERPWWSSGESERLGVVFKEGVAGNALKSLITRWGLDPVFDSANPAPGPTLAAFPLRKESMDGNLSLEEHGSTARIFSVAGHSVEFDAERKLWFSDIVVSAGSSYFPFIRLALARFQPHSLQDCHLSRVVQTDFIQLVPDRTLDLRPIATRKYRVKVFGVAPKETFVSRTISSALVPRSATSASVADVLPAKVTAAQVAQVFQAGPLSEITEVERVPGVFGAAATPASPSKRVGLNEYTVVIEKLPEGASPDFGWVVESGVTVTEPPPPPPSRVPANPKLTKRKTIPRKGTAGASVASAGSAPSKVSKADALKATTATDALAGLATLAIAPLWEGDVTLPAANDGLPRRLVMREHELYFKATPNAGEFIAIARRLVYADIVPLPVD